MIVIETNGSWREIGRQYAEQAGKRLHDAIDHYAGWLKTDLDKYKPRISELREQALQHCPDLVEETDGMAEGAGLDEMLMFGYRFFGELGPWAPKPEQGCSCIFLPDAEYGPLLGRNCDLEHGNKVSTCHISRPEEGVANIKTSYLGMAGVGGGVNAHGLGMAGASATTTEGEYDVKGLATGILSRMLLGQCDSVGSAVALLQNHRFMARGCVWIVADSSGAAALVEHVPGRVPLVTPMSENRRWLACTNFYISRDIPNACGESKHVRDLDSAYARYGRIAHQLGEGIALPNLDGLRQLLLDVAQPGMCQLDSNVLWTAHSQIMDLRNRRMYVTEGHPAEGPFVPHML